MNYSASEVSLQIIRDPGLDIIAVHLVEPHQVTHQQASRSDNGRTPRLVLSYHDDWLLRKDQTRQENCLRALLLCDDDVQSEHVRYAVVGEDVVYPLALQHVLPHLQRNYLNSCRVQGERVLIRIRSVVVDAVELTCLSLLWD